MVCRVVLQMVDGEIVSLRVVKRQGDNRFYFSIHWKEAHKKTLHNELIIKKEMASCSNLYVVRYLLSLSGEILIKKFCRTAIYWY